MPLRFRLTRPEEYEHLEEMIIDSFAPVTWFRTLEERFGPLNGVGWRERWKKRFRHVFDTQIILVGENEDGPAALATGTIDDQARLGYIDLLGVDRRYQGRGYGRAMLHGMMEHMRQMGALYVNLDCLVDNDRANHLYRSEGFQEVARHIRWFAKL